jgi:hypothetical protein
MRLIPFLAVTILAKAPLFAAPITFESGETRVALVELFSSEGCSSCPRADAWMGAMKNSPDLWQKLVPVVFHVDYWDRLGWPDRFASAAFTERQRRYASAWHTNSVYTPGFVVNGREWRGWFDGKTLPVAPRDTVGKLRITQRDSQHAEVAFTPAGKTPDALSVEVALLGSGLKTDVQRGENAGRKLGHDFVVLHHQRVKLVPGDGRFSAAVALPEKMPAPAAAIAAWVSAGDSQEPLQAVGGWLVRP